MPKYVGAEWKSIAITRIPTRASQNTRDVLKAVYKRPHRYWTPKHRANPNTPSKSIIRPLTSSPTKDQHSPESISYAKECTRTAIAMQHKLTYGLSRSPILAALQNVPSGLNASFQLAVQALRRDRSIREIEAP
jgi:hypothetical protein